VLGLATINDKDILIYCVSQLMKAVNQDIYLAKKGGNEKFIAPSRKVRFRARDLLVITNKETSGNGDKR